MWKEENRTPVGRPDFKSGERRSTSLVGSTPTLFRQHLWVRPVRIVNLIEAPETAATLEDWFTTEWAPWYGPEGPGNAANDLAACSGRESLPVCLVALDLANDVVGTASLKAESVGSELGVGPWLAAVLVPSEHRGRGIGTALVEAIERQAVQLGFTDLYTSTDMAERILTRRSWVEFGATNSLRGPIKVFRRRLAPRAI